MADVPSYEGKNIAGGTPIFSGDANDRSRFGMCVRTADIPPGTGLLEASAANCPIPCNPTWPVDLVDTVCGTGRACCQTLPLQPEDCVLDPDTSHWRPVRGEDIGTLTSWAPSSHARHQDPNGIGCTELAAGNDDAWIDCIQKLTVADQRGYCMALATGTCPGVAPEYIDACEALDE